MGIAVIGGGVAGITTALDLADAGYKVYLIEKNAQLGGKVSELAECETGISPRIVKIENHPNIELMLSSELESLSGSAGDFKLSVSGGKELNVESVVLTPGYDVYEDIAKSYAIDNPDVVSSLEFEGMLRACTVSETGALVRPSNGQPVKKIGFIKCIGSRCKENEICSTACCGYTAKEVWELKERYPDMDVYVFYMDVRAFGKDEELVAKLKEKYGVHYIRSRVPEVLAEGGLTVKYEDLANGTIEQLGLDMVVLAVGLLPSKTMAKLAEITGVNLDPYGFIATSMTSPVETSVPGIFAGGTAIAPMKVRESVILSTGAAAKAAQLSERTEMIPGQEEHKYMEVGEKPKIGVFICGCEGEVTDAMDVPVVAEHVGGLRDVAVVNTETSTVKEAMNAVESGIVDQGLNRIVVAGYSPRAYEEIFRDACAKAGLNPYLLEMVNLREQCACVHDREEATVAAMSQLTMAVERARYLEPVPLEQYPVTPKALVVGGGVAGMTAALDIANAGYEVCLVEKEVELGGSLTEAIEFQSDVKAADVLADLVEKVKGNERITVYTGAAVEDVRGRVGAFKAKVSGGGAGEDIEFGAAVLATGAREFVPEGYFGYGQTSNVVTQTEFAKMLADSTVDANTVVMIQDGVSGDGINPKYTSIEAVSNVLKAKELKPELNVFMLFQDVKTYGKWEMAYKAAREKGVTFIRYDGRRPPAFADGIVSVFDVIFNDEIQIKPDMIVLSPLMQPAAENEQLSKMFMVPLKNGFFMEAQERPKLVLTPVDTVNEGVFICGSGVAPALIDESIGMGSAAASRACVLLAKSFLETPGIVSIVDEEICAGCGVCVEMCPVEAIELIEEPVAAVTYNIMTTTSGTKKVARVTAEGCIGCGSCAAYCPSNSISLQNFRARQLYAQLDFA